MECEAYKFVRMIRANEEYICCLCPTIDGKPATVDDILSKKIPNKCVDCVSTDKYTFNKNKYSTSINENDILLGTIVLNSNCNGVCRMCNSKYPEHNELENFNKVKDFINENKNTLKTLTILGGEVFLVKDRLNEILDIVKYMNLDKFVIVTNGTINDYDIYTKIKEIKNSVIIFSICGIGEKNELIRHKQNINVIKKSIDLAIELGIKFEIHSTISLFNCFEFVEFVKYIKELTNDKYSGIHFIPVINPVIQSISILDDDTKSDIKKIINDNKDFFTENRCSGISRVESVLNIDNFNIKYIYDFLEDICLFNVVNEIESSELLLHNRIVEFINKYLK